MIKTLIKSQLTKNKELIFSETRQVNGFMKLLMKQKNTGAEWTKTEKDQLKKYLQHMALYIPVLFIFLLPLGMLLIPIMAEILDRRKASRSTQDKSL